MLLKTIFCIFLTADIDNIYADTNMYVINDRSAVLYISSLYLHSNCITSVNFSV